MIVTATTPLWKYTVTLKPWNRYIILIRYPQFCYSRLSYCDLNLVSAVFYPLSSNKYKIIPKQLLWSAKKKHFRYPGFGIYSLSLRAVFLNCLDASRYRNLIIFSAGLEMRFNKNIYPISILEGKTKYCSDNKLPIFPPKHKIKICPQPDLWPQKDKKH